MKKKEFKDNVIEEYIDGNLYIMGAIFINDGDCLYCASANGETGYELTGESTNIDIYNDNIAVVKSGDTRFYINSLGNILSGKAFIDTKACCVLLNEDNTLDYMDKTTGVVQRFDGEILGIDDAAFHEHYQEYDRTVLNITDKSKIWYDNGRVLIIDRYLIDFKKNKAYFLCMGYPDTYGFENIGIIYTNDAIIFWDTSLYESTTRSKLGTAKWVYLTEQESLYKVYNKSLDEDTYTLRILGIEHKMDGTTSRKKVVDVDYSNDLIGKVKPCKSAKVIRSGVIKGFDPLDSRFYKVEQD